MIEIADMQIAHVYELAKTLREGDRLECEAIDIDPKAMLRKAYYTSVMKKVTLIDGKVAGAWGIESTVLGYRGLVWLMTSTLVEQAPLQLALAYRRSVSSMLKIFPRLENHCDSRYTRSLKMLQLCGFTVEDPTPYGPKNALFCRFHKEV